MIYNTTFSRWLKFLALLGSQVEGFVAKAFNISRCIRAMRVWLLCSCSWTRSNWFGSSSWSRLRRRISRSRSSASSSFPVWYLCIQHCWMWSSFKWMVRQSPFIHSTRSARYEAWSPYLTCSRRSRRAARTAWLYMVEDCIMSGDWSVPGCGFYSRIGVVLMTVLPIMWSGLLSILAIPQFYVCRLLESSDYVQRFRRHTGP